jgi:hypothetical protein
MSRGRLEAMQTGLCSIVMSYNIHVAEVINVLNLKPNFITLKVTNNSWQYI